MSRLLLVDDNPSIHKIAETLLGSSSIELVCVGSAQEALMMLDSGERFDVALIDTAMPGMDGWELLTRMRKHPDSAFIPIAMMAGVLDTVDPEKLHYAPIQGFLKKPIELRELAARVHQLLATPVTLAENEESSDAPSVLSPFSTVPGTRMKNLPEFRDAAIGHPPEDMVLDDLLLLTPEDFWPEEAPAPTHSTLDLEELDLDALKDLHGEDIPTQPEASFPTQPVEDEIGEETLEVPGLAIPAHELPDMGEVPDFEDMGLESPLPEAQTPVSRDEVPASRRDSEFPSAAASAFAPPHPYDEQDESAEAEPEPMEAPSIPPPSMSAYQDSPALMPPPMSPPMPTGEGHHAVAQAILSDPVLMDALAKALVARLGDQVLREIAWELMPELAEKLPR